jgi:hypothetical protein
MNTDFKKFFLFYPCLSVLIRGWMLPPHRGIRWGESPREPFFYPQIAQINAETRSF